MSTYIYLQCDDHNPPIKSWSESGARLYDLKDVREDLANREQVIETYNVDAYNEEGRMPFRQNTAAFLDQHPHCNISIWDEYGRFYPNVEHDHVWQFERVSSWDSKMLIYRCTCDDTTIADAALPAPPKETL